MKQIQWLTQLNNPDLWLEYLQLRKRNLSHFDKVFQLFSMAPTLDRYKYEDNVDAFKVHLIPMAFTPIMTLMYLFNVSGLGNDCLFDDAPYIVDQDHDNAILLEWCHDVYGSPTKEQILTSIKACSQLAAIFEAHSDWENERGKIFVPLKTVFRREIGLMFSTHENVWFDNEMDNFSYIFHSVGTSDDDIKSLVHYNKTGDLNMNLLTSLLNNGMERVRRVLFDNAQFQGLPKERQALNWKAVQPLAQSLFILQYESAPDPISQFSFGFRASDRSRFERTIKATYGPKQSFSRRLTCAAVPGATDDSSLTCIIVNSLKMTRITWMDMDVFRLLMLLIVSSGPDLKDVFRCYERHWLKLLKERKLPLTPLHDIITSVAMVAAEAFKRGLQYSKPPREKTITAHHV